MLIPAIIVGVVIGFLVGRSPVVKRWFNLRPPVKVKSAMQARVRILRLIDETHPIGRRCHSRGLIIECAKTYAVNEAQRLEKEAKFLDKLAQDYADREALLCPTVSEQCCQCAYRAKINAFRREAEHCRKAAMGFRESRAAASPS